jgi:anti-sigma factor (TIGR02949 family)
MDCQETQKFVHVYVDGEFAEPDRREFERHLQTCAECRAVVRFEERFKAALRSRVSIPQAPAALFEAVRQGLDRQPEPAAPQDATDTTRRWGYGIAGLAAAVAAAVLVALWVWPGGEKKPLAHHPLEASVAHHEREMPFEITGPDRTMVEKWYRDKVDVPVRPPVLRRVGANLSGGRLVDFNKLPAAYLVYDRGGHKISVHVFDPRKIPRRGLVRHRIGKRNVYFGVLRGHNVAVFRHRGAGYAITADLDRNDLSKVVRTVLHQPRSYRPAPRGAVAHPPMTH